MSSKESHHSPARPTKSPRRPAGPSRWTSRARLTVAALLGVIAAVVALVVGAPRYAALIGWDAAAATFVVSVWAVIASMSSDSTASHATREDPGRAGSDILAVSAAVASLAAVGGVLVQASSEKGSTKDLLAGLAVLSVVLSWLTVHTLFTLRYARLYYTGHDGGIDFNQHADPRYLDFAYLSFAIGMTFQVSDTDLQSPAIRASALRHALLSYLFGAVILASTVNLIANLTGNNG